MTEESSNDPIDIPLIKPKTSDEDRQREIINPGLFSAAPSSRRDNDHASLFTIDPPSSPSLRDCSTEQYHPMTAEVDPPPTDEEVGSQGFKPIIQVVSSSDGDLSMPSKQSRTVSFASQTDGDNGDGSVWATTANTSSQPTNTAAKHEPLLIEEIEDDPPGLQQFDKTQANHDTVVEASEALSRVQATPTSQLSLEEKMWQLAAVGGSTIEDDEVQLDQETKRKLRARLNEAGNLDKVSLQF